MSNSRSAPGGSGLRLRSGLLEAVDAYDAGASRHVHPECHPVRGCPTSRCSTDMKKKSSQEPPRPRWISHRVTAGDHPVTGAGMTGTRPVVAMLRWSGEAASRRRGSGRPRCRPRTPSHSCASCHSPTGVRRVSGFGGESSPATSRTRAPGCDDAGVTRTNTRNTVGFGDTSSG